MNHAELPAPEAVTIPPEGGDIVARQTAQAKLLREARDTIAAAVKKMAEKKDRKALAKLGLAPDRIKELLGGADFNTADLAYILGVSLETLRNWTYDPATAQRAREMPKTAILLLERIMEDTTRR